MIGIYAEFNMAFLSAEMAADFSHCKPLSPELLRHFGGTAPAFTGHHSVACEDRESDGGIVVTVHALAGRTTEVDIDFNAERQGRAPYIQYFATLRTRPDRLGQDIPKFRIFLRRLRIGVPLRR